jgi:ribonucleotide monophosphatase NagD (HAD superfamily)|tara:strand:+ start:2942 stop:3283 length:342 start_codon:yes stop_codon:yes gene_type:complete
MDKKNTYFVDIDGTIFVYRKFETYESTDATVIKGSKQYLQQVKDEGHMIILTTARPENMRKHTIKELSLNGIPYDRLIMGIERGPRYLINDMDPNNPGKRAIAINVNRNVGIK